MIPAFWLLTSCSINGGDDFLFPYCSKKQKLNPHRTKETLDETSRTDPRGGHQPCRGHGGQAADKVTLQLKWVTQAQFAGYYVAKDKGLYKAENLDVTIKPGGPDVAPPQVIAGGGADVVIDWMPSALASREKGVPLVNIAQPFQSIWGWSSPAAPTPASNRRPIQRTRRSACGSPATNTRSSPGWAKLGLQDRRLGGGGVKVLKQGFNVDPLLQKQADCISTMTYNEYWQVIDGGHEARPTSWWCSNTPTRA